MTARPPIGTRYRIAWADGTRSGVTVVPTGKAVPADQVNVMRDGDGSIVTVNIDRLGPGQPAASFDPRSPSMRLWRPLVGRGVDADADYPAHAVDGADYAADVIDPSAGPVRPDEEPTP